MSIVEKAIQKLQKQASDVPVLHRTPLPEQIDPAAPLHRASPSVRPRFKVDRVRLRSEGLLPLDEEERRLAAELRRIKRPLVSRARTGAADGGASPRVVAVTSAAPLEGKSFIALNLALSMSLEHDLSVLLVDGDVAKPQMSSLFDLAESPGLLDALADESSDPDGFVHDTDVRNLCVLAAGRRTDDATELLASERMHQIVARLCAADPRRIVIFDTPPMLLTTESAEIAKVAGQVLIVVRADFTPRQAVLDTIAAIGDGKSIGLVLNQVDRASSDAQYYGYGQYGSYGRSNEPAAT